jgi:hypothetical protein
LAAPRRARATEELGHQTIRERRLTADRSGGTDDPAELIAKLKSDDPDGVREVVIWDSDEELIKGVGRVELKDDRDVVDVSRAG